MKIFDAETIKEIDAYTIKHEPVESIDLMERAAARLTGWYVRHYHTDRRVLVFAGPGNNGGDGLAMARQLARRQYRVTCAVLQFGKRSTDNAANLKRLRDQGLVEISEVGEGDPLPEIRHDDVVVDAVFGSGLTRTVTGFPEQVIRHIGKHAGQVISVDIPSGLFGEDNSDNQMDSVVSADATLTFQFPFLSFFFQENESHVGRWRVQDIRLHPDIIGARDPGYQTIEKMDAARGIPPRGRYSHKGTFGHALLISGSYGMMGAALLSGRSALRSGTGLVTLHVPRFGYSIVQTAFPEAIVSMDQSDILFSEPPDLSAFSAVGVGPGLGTKPNTARGLKDLLDRVESPLVIDADGLNILSAHPEWYNVLPEGTVLTPHPREFDRLAGASPNSYQRHLKQKEFAKRYGVCVILKGGHTGVASPDGRYWFNVTGNPGMATGGSGDVLTGLVTGLLAQGMSPVDACLAGVYLHGRAGDLAAGKTGQQAMIAGDLIDHLGTAFRELF